jgi:peptidoglycan/LPS O-acetylase OafA/YrhL
MLPPYLAHLAFIHPFFPDWFQSISGPLWTIGVEVQFYLVFPLLCGWFLRNPIRAASAVALVSGGYRWWIDGTHHLDFFWMNQVVAFLDVFAAGMLASYVVSWYRNRPEHQVPGRRMTVASVVTATIALSALVVLSHSAAMNGDVDFFAWEAHWRLTLAAILFVLIATTTLALPEWRRVVSNRFFAYLAVISYNLYLWHLEVLAQSQRGHLPLPVAVLTAFAIATAVTYLLERPLLRVKLPALASTRPLVEREAQAA